MSAEFYPAIAAPLSKARPGIREKLTDFLEALKAADPEVQIILGNPVWHAIDAFKRGGHFARVFCKPGLIKIDNLVPGSKPGDYGDLISLGEKGEWSYQVRASSPLPEELMLCVSDVLAHVGGRRSRFVRPGHARPGVVREEQKLLSRRSSLRPSTRFAILVRDNYTCQYCGRAAPEVVLQVDHRVPVAAGGHDGLDNLVTSCVDCNQGKGARHST